MVFNSIYYLLLTYSSLRNTITSQVLKALASVAQCNFLQAKRLLQESEQIIFTGNAEATLQATTILTEAGIKHIITPNFKYQGK